jgi:hypothetical protein
MEKIQSAAENLQKLVDETPIKLLQFSMEEINHKPDAKRWSKKEILGHLCDSCANNLMRIIRVQYEKKPFIIYNQDEWVQHQNYQKRDISEVVDLWIMLHRQFIHVISNFPENQLDSIINVGEEVTAGFIITDYLDHQNHHLKQIFGVK